MKLGLIKEPSSKPRRWTADMVTIFEIEQIVLYQRSLELATIGMTKKM